MLEEIKTVIVEGKTMTLPDFFKYQEEVSKDKSKLLKEVSPGVFTILSRIRG